MTLRYIFVLLLVLFSINTQADDAQKLKQLQQEIKRLERWLAGSRDRHNKISQSIRRLDVNISDLLQAINHNREKLDLQRQTLRELTQQQRRLNQNTLSNKQKLKEQVLAAQRLGQQGSVKLLLSQNNLQYADRMLIYYRYFNQARLSKIQSLMSELQKLSEVEQKINAQQQKLLETESVLVDKKQKLASNKREQQQLLAHLASKIDSQSDVLLKKQENRKRLEALLDEVATLLDVGPRETDSRPFRSQKGRLPIPVVGKLIRAFGNENVENRERWHGWLLAAPEGNSIQAVHHGRVVFADWLRGFGLLIIIDHGRGYLSLYAHNQALYKKVGAWVNRGDVIATVGRSGAQEQAALYFEIRYKGKPSDPALWIKRKRG